MSVPAFPLFFLKDGRSAVIKDIEGGYGMKKRLSDLGLVKGLQVMAVKNDDTGPMIISIREGRLAVGKGMSLKIMVEEKE